MVQTKNGATIGRSVAARTRTYFPEWASGRWDAQARPARQRVIGKPCTHTAGVVFEPITVRIPTAVKPTGIGRSKLYDPIQSGDVETVRIGTVTIVRVAGLTR